MRSARRWTSRPCCRPSSCGQISSPARPAATSGSTTSCGRSSDSPTHYPDERDAAALPAPGGVSTVPKGQGLTTRVIELRQPVQIPDIAVEGTYESPVRNALINTGHRALLGVPLVSEDEVIGVLGVTRRNRASSAARSSSYSAPSPPSPLSRSRTPGSSTRSRTRAASSRRPVATSPSSWPTCPDELRTPLSKVEAGRLELEAMRFDLPTALDNTLTLVRERATRHGITLTQTVDPGVADRGGRAEGEADPVEPPLQCREVHPGGGRVGLSATRLLHPRGQVRSPRRRGDPRMALERLREPPRSTTLATGSARRCTR